MISANISGWYYDLQLENRLTCATLHPNKILKENGNKWDDFDASDADPDEPKYRATPICSAILSEDFNVSVANSWSAFGNDMLGQMWESIKPLAPYAGAITGMINNAAEQWKKEKKTTKDEINESFLSRTMAKLMVGADQMLKGGKINITDYLNRSLVVQGTRFSYYSGSGTSFGNLVMKFTIFPTYDSHGKYITVDKQVQDILPYCIGRYVSGSSGIEESEDVSKDDLLKIDSIIGWQKPPGGFESYFRDVDTVQNGTLMLRFGAYYAITNLVVENANFNFSKQLTKNPTGGELLSPLYCDVTIQLKPATKYSDKFLRRFVFGRSSINTLKQVETQMKTNLLKPASHYSYVH